MACIYGVVGYGCVGVGVSVRVCVGVDDMWTWAQRGCGWAVGSRQWALRNGPWTARSAQWAVGCWLSALGSGSWVCAVRGLAGSGSPLNRRYGPFSEGGIAPVVGCAGCGRDGGCFCSKTKHLTLD